MLAAEDDHSDLWFLTQAVEGAGIAVCLYAVRDGDEVLRYLKAEGEFSDRENHPVPDLLLLDLKMPRMGGLDVLKWMKENPEFKGLPTLVLSGSVMMDDVRQAYNLGASGFFTKPNSFEDLKEVVRTILDYWRRCQRPEQFGLARAEYQGARTRAT